VPIKASSGHWRITEHLLHFAMRRAVATQSLLAPQPPRELDSPEMTARGAAHFDLGCRSCHGAPGDRLPPLPQAMTPHPPRLSDRVPELARRELFFIVKHGVKFTGMPAWPVATRDDEVWEMVSFLRRLPDLTPHEYKQLAGVTDASMPVAGHPVPTAVAPAPPELVVEQCAACHGRDGAGRGGAFPALAGQRLEYLQRAMQAYADGRRFSGTMQIVAASLSPDARDASARYYSALPPLDVPAPWTEPARRGAAIAQTGVAAQDIPSCDTCHGADADVNRAYPRLRGQYAWYIIRQLELLKARGRGGSAFVPIMHQVADQLSAGQIRDIAEYYAAPSPR
jgi:cytochrome c553